MFDNDCQVCAQRVLIFPSQVTSLTNAGEDGLIEVAFTCWCGTEQTKLTGKGIGQPRAHPVAA
ncbi:hypothetical protein [Nocardioides speluncae]|uniref:hypothetical protein n=1 Tax=Nocardioides speluncae TaxID=2670337 RepID=UPI000D69670A|nr:hypothetical protein [Nocardioides speluncae]